MCSAFFKVDFSTQTQDKTNKTNTAMTAQQPFVFRMSPSGLFSSCFWGQIKAKLVIGGTTTVSFGFRSMYNYTWNTDHDCIPDNEAHDQANLDST